MREYTIPSFNSLVPEVSDRTGDHLHAYISEYLVSDGDRITAVGQFCPKMNVPDIPFGVGVI